MLPHIERDPAQPFTLEERVAINSAFCIKLMGSSPSRFDQSRFIAAQTLALDPEQFAISTAKYSTTIWNCKCPDHSIRRLRCKHMIAMMLDGCIFA